MIVLLRCIAIVHDCVYYNILITTRVEGANFLYIYIHTCHCKGSTFSAFKFMIWP